MASHIAKIVIPGLAMFGLCLADESETTEGFRSQLWTMEYREADVDSSQNQPSQSERSGAVAGGTIHRTAIVAGVQGTDTTTTGRVSAKEVTLADVQQQTPIADWQIEQGASDTDHSGELEAASAWQLSRAGHSHREGAATSSKGPSVTTFLVAIVACVVVTGALFSGRD